MNEAEKKLIQETGGRRSALLAECLRLRREKARLYELLLWKSKRVVTRRDNRGYWREESRLWRDEEIDKELRNGED